MTQVLLKIKTDHKIAVIKEVRSIFAWGLYEAKEAVENGIIFNQLEALHNFMYRLSAAMVSNTTNATFVPPTYTIEPFRRGGVPQDASDVTIWT